MGKEVINGLKPEILWNIFYDITQVPRPSKKEEKIREFIRSFANKHNFEFKEDDAGNIVIKVPASPGKENAPTVVLQGHIDMVCEKNKEKAHNFETDPLTILREGEWIKADGTTLGADNGIGVAASLAVALDKDVVHGPLEILCTIDEETGMTGASSLSSDAISGKYLLNLDSEEDGVFYVGCAGGQDTVGSLKIEWTAANKNYLPFEVTVTGLAGGHSGLDIHRGRANSIKLLAYLLARLPAKALQVFEITGGSLRNAIPREASVKFLLDSNEIDNVKNIINEFQKDALLEYKVSDPDLNIKFQPLETTVNNVYSNNFFETLLKILLALPHGVISMSKEIQGLVETSTNLATVSINDNAVIIGTSQRSSIESAKNNISRSVAAVFQLAGIEPETGDGYPGWTPNMDSELLKLSRDIYKKLFNKEAEVKAIHAGLETGLLGSKFKGLDMISFGPTILGAHSPTEKVNIPAVEKFYFLLKNILGTLAER